MQATIRQWGNSLALRLPRHIAEEVHLVDGATVNLEIENGSLKVTPTRKRFKLSELLENEPKRGSKPSTREVDWGNPSGDEAW